MNSPKALDVVVVNYNAGGALKQCLSQLIGFDGVNLILVDNNSSDTSINDLKNSELSAQWLLIENQSNLGFATACNQGARLGRSKYLAFVNPDCFVTAEQLQRLTVTLSQQQQAALIGCRVLNEDGSLQAASRRRLPTFWRIFCHLTRLSYIPGFAGINIKDSEQLSEVQKVEAVNGSCLVIKRSYFEQLGGYDADYPLHFEDLDLFTRVQKQGWDILYQPSIEVTHLKGQSSGNSNQVKLWKRQGLLRYLSLHRPAWEYRFAQFILGSK